MVRNVRSLVKLIARLSPWLAPLPSGFFVARASISHLELPVIIGISAGIIIEFLGISSVHTWLWLADWNSNKRKSDPGAPTLLAASLGVIYLSATIGLTVVLEVAPTLSIYAPVLFPALAIVGAINLVLISQQEQLEQVAANERQLRQFQRLQPPALRPFRDVHLHTQFTSTLEKDYTLNATNRARKQVKTEKIAAIVDLLNEYPEIGVAELARRIGRSRTAVYKYLKELELIEQIIRSGVDGRIHGNRVIDRDLQQP